jgi:hypothetical protein
VRPSRSLTVGTAVAAIVGCIGLSATVVSYAATGATSSHHSKRPMVMIGSTGNKVEMVDPDHSTYVPRIGAASDKDLAYAKKVLAGVNRFCAHHTVAQLKRTWRPGHTRSTKQTHLFNPVHSQGVHPKSPTAALIYDGKVAGEMFNGTPLPHLGSIPRPHGHADMSTSMEMLHVYCTGNLKHAYTPNRQLGIMLPIFHLRDKIRPAVMNLTPAQLHAVVHKVRGYIGKRQAANVRAASKGGPDPRLQAMRDEIRRSLMVLGQHQLRSVWRLMKSY